MRARFTYVGGPTALLEVGGLRLLTDPTFDPAGEEYPTPVYTLRKTQSPALGADALGRIDAVLLSHDHHFDNLDRAGRQFLERIGTVLTTEAGAGRLAGIARGLSPWQTFDLEGSGGRRLRVTATPARHGPANADRGPVVGFTLSSPEAPREAIYLSGDTVWYEGVAEVSRRFDVRAAVLFMGAARVLEVGPAHLTFTGAEGVEAARAFPKAPILPVHCEGWAHFSESPKDITAAFAAAGLADRLFWGPAGRAAEIPIVS